MESFAHKEMHDILNILFIKSAKRVDLFGNSELSFPCRSLPEPLMTYELHGDFIVPASKYCVKVIETVLWLTVYMLKFPLNGN